MAKNHEGEGLRHPYMNLHPDSEFYPATLIPISLCHPTKEVTSSINRNIVEEALKLSKEKKSISDVQASLTQYIPCTPKQQI